ncbi:MAG: hypothetical protein LCH93_13790 [Proteobacteria bacterium]|nr:hypothetical protein [Pseudomonadota bacterium]
MAVAAFAGMAAIFARHLGEDAPLSYVPVTGSAITLPPGRVIYREQPVVDFDDGESAGTDSVQRTLHLQVADVPNPIEGDRVTVRGTTYKVVPPIARDGNGMVVVTLAKV